MKQKWLWIAAAILVVAVIVLVLRLTVFAPETDPDPTPTPSDTTPTTTTTTAPVEDVVTPANLHFDGKVLEVDGDSVLMECYDEDKFGTVWVNYAQILSVMPQIGEEYTVVYEDLIMPSLPPRITAVEMRLLYPLTDTDFTPSVTNPTQTGQVELQGGEFQSGDFVYTKVEDGIAILAHLDVDAVHIDVPQEIDGLPVVRIGGGDGFYQHKALESITLPEGLKRITDSCFYRCYSLKTVVIPSTVTDICANPFWRASSLSEIQVAPGSKSFKTVDGVLYDITGETLISFPEGKKQEDFYIPDFVKMIRDDAFGYHPQVRNLYLTKTVCLESACLTAHEKDLCLHIYKNSPVDKMLQELAEPYHPYEYR